MPQGRDEIQDHPGPSEDALDADVSEWQLISRSLGHKSYELTASDLAAVVQLLKHVPPELLRRMDRIFGH